MFRRCTEIYNSHPFWSYLEFSWAASSSVSTVTRGWFLICMCTKERFVGAQRFPMLLPISILDWYRKLWESKLPDIQGQGIGALDFIHMCKVTALFWWFVNVIQIECTVSSVPNLNLMNNRAVFQVGLFHGGPWIPFLMEVKIYLHLFLHFHDGGCIQGYFETKQLCFD